MSSGPRDTHSLRNTVARNRTKERSGGRFKDRWRKQRLRCACWGLPHRFRLASVHAYRTQCRVCDRGLSLGCSGVIFGDRPLFWNSADDFCVTSADFARLAEGVFGVALVAGSKETSVYQTNLSAELTCANKSNSTQSSVQLSVQPATGMNTAVA